MTTNNIWNRLAVLALLMGMAVAGCKSDAKQAVPSNDAGVSDASNNAGSGGGGGGSGGMGGEGAGSGGSGAGTGGMGGSGGEIDSGMPVEIDGGPNCIDTAHDSCYACMPSKPEHYLNACVDGFTCVPYDNSALGLTGGKLPKIP